jgi:DNA-binding CsgD family transcriptional regulator
MGADHPIVLEPRCPAEEDPGVQEYLRLAKALTDAAWVELELRPNGLAPARTYRIGAGTGKTVVASLEAGVDFDASLRLGMTAQPSTELVMLMSDCLSRILEFRNMRIQIMLLRSVLDTSSHLVLIFDNEGHILFANPPADHLLSLQTEDELPASFNGQPQQPLFTLLSSLVERVISGDGAASPRTGAIELGDGRMVAFEATRVAGFEQEVPDAVLVILRPTESESDIRVQAFAASHNLSPREQEVLYLLGRGLTTAAMAEELGISPHTVRDHLKHLYRKTGTKGRSELLGLISRASTVSVDSRESS